ncbi:MAG TPA: TonB-dependent receptor plug domain-containing protein, partial [Arachidicoccus sp.]
MTSLSLAQSKVVFIFKDAASNQLIASASVAINNKNIAFANDSARCTLSLQNAKYLFAFSCTGYEKQTSDIDIIKDTTINVIMQPGEQSLHEVEVVSTMRNNQPIESAPIKIEVLGKQEMDEESTIKPASIASILGDVSGVQVLQSSATSGNVNVHIQGLSGRYTQILKDGIPMYDGFSGNFGILSIPPLDLQQIELVKGSASTLYGGGAIGGLINLISRKPANLQDATFIVNQSSLDETDLNGFAAKRYKHFGYTMFTGYTHQKQQDINKDGFSDLPSLHSFNIHPRLFYYNNQTTITAGYNATFEKRNGGDMLALNNKPQGIHQYFEDNHTNRHTAEFNIEQSLSSNAKFYFKNSASWFNNNYTSNTLNYYGKQLDYYSELSTLVSYGHHSSF